MNTFKLALISLSLGLLGSFSGYSQEEGRSAATLPVPLSHLPVAPSVVNTGSVNVEMINLFYYGIAAQYDWRISSRWTLGGMVSGGVNAMAAILSRLPYPPSPSFKSEIRGRWHFDRSFRVRNGFSLRNNSGFYLAPTLGYILDIPQRYGSHDKPASERSERSIPEHTIYSMLCVGYQYTARSHFYWGAGIGLGYGLLIDPNNRNKENRSVVSPTVAAILHVRIGYAF